jgi:hypothetical protein
MLVQRSFRIIAAYAGSICSPQWLGDEQELFFSREEAYNLYRSRDDFGGAARVAMWIASDYSDFRGEVSLVME